MSSVVSVPVSPNGHGEEPIADASPPIGDELYFKRSKTLVFYLQQLPSLFKRNDIPLPRGCKERRAYWNNIVLDLMYYENTVSFLSYQLNLVERLAVKHSLSPGLFVDLGRTSPFFVYHGPSELKFSGYFFKVSGGGNSQTHYSHTHAHTCDPPARARATLRAHDAPAPARVEPRDY